MKKIFWILALYFFLILSKTTIKAAKNNCGFVRSFQDQNEGENILAALPNGFLAVGSSLSGGINIWDTENASLILSINSPEILSLFVLPDGTLTSGSSGELDFFNTTDGSILNYIYRDPLFSPYTFALLENGYLAVGSIFVFVSIEIWNINNNTLVNTINTGYSHGVTSLVYIEGDLLASTDGSLATIDIWNASNGQLVRTFDDNNQVNCLLTLKNGSLISGSEYKTIKVWDPKNGDLLNTLTGHTGSVNSLAEFPEGFLASGGDDGIKVWDLSNGKLVATFENSQAYNIVALPNRFLASATDSVDVKIWNVKDCVSKNLAI